MKDGPRLDGLSRSPKGGRRPAPWWVLFATLGVLTAQVAAIGHAVIFTHTRCEHGAFVHASGHAREAGPSLATPLDRELSVRRGGDSHGEHEHCEGFATLPAIVGVAAPSVALGVLASPFVPSVLVRDGENAVAILSLAPKTSPTAV